jgi:threonine dehydrogenase-like Zn-dependent dehydrogenase
MLSHRLALADAAEGYRLMNERAEGVTKVALRPGS